jgi:hypothetical protein
LKESLTPAHEEKGLAQEPIAAPPDIYLAGMRLSHTRPPTDAERWVLAVVGYGGGLIGALLGTFAVELVRDPMWLRNYPLLCIIALVVSPFGIGFAAFVAEPALRTLRREKVLVFKGPVLSLGPFDANQQKLFMNKPYPDEMVVMANRQTVLRAGKRFLPYFNRLKEPCRVVRDRGPDTRRLTEAERQELRRLIKRFGRPDVVTWIPLLIIPFISVPIVSRFAALEVAFFGICALLILFTAALYFHKMSSWKAFSRLLEKDLEDGVISSGNLWSGLPWLVNGEPAGWRTIRPEVGVNKLDVEVLRTL